MSYIKKRDFERAMALIIDSFFVNLIYNLIFNNFNEISIVEINYNFLLLTFLIYFILFDTINNGKTLGKIFLNIKPEKYLDRNERFLRTFTKIVSIYLTPITFIVYVMKNKVLHDLLLENRQTSVK